jgi:hypothetical protein
MHNLFGNLWYASFFSFYVLKIFIKFNWIQQNINYLDFTIILSCGPDGKKILPLYKKIRYDSQAGDIIMQFKPDSKERVLDINFFGKQILTLRSRFDLVTGLYRKKLISDYQLPITLRSSISFLFFCFVY